MLRSAARARPYERPRDAPTEVSLDNDRFRDRQCALSGCRRRTEQADDLERGARPARAHAVNRNRLTPETRRLTCDALRPLDRGCEIATRGVCVDRDVADRCSQK